MNSCICSTKPKQEVKKFKVKHNDNLIGCECLICLNQFNENDKVSLIKCGHVYHSKCLSLWFIKKKSCPICRVIIIL